MRHRVASFSGSAKSPDSEVTSLFVLSGFVIHYNYGKLVTTKGLRRGRSFFVGAVCAPLSAFSAHDAGLCRGSAVGRSPF